MNKDKPHKYSKRTIAGLWIATLVIVCFSVSAQYVRDPATGKFTDFEKLYNDLKAQPAMPIQIVFEVNVFEVLLKDTTDIGFIYDVLGELGTIRGTNLAGDANIESDLSVLDKGNRNSMLPAGANITANVFEGDGGELRAIFQALAQDQIVRIHANPIILTVAGVPAHLTSGDDIPFLERSSLTTTDTFASNYQTTGVNLVLTPSVIYSEADVEHKNPIIKVTLNVDLSSVTRYREEQGFAQPIVDSRNLNTTVYLRSNQPVLIGGLFRDMKGDRGREIPILRDIPILGRFFRSTSTTSTMSQFLVMIRPSIFDVWGQGIQNDLIIPKQNFEKISDLIERKAKERSSDKNYFEEFREIFLDSSSVKK